MFQRLASISIYTTLFGPENASFVPAVYLSNHLYEVLRQQKDVVSSFGIYAVMKVFFRERQTFCLCLSSCVASIPYDW